MGKAKLILWLFFFVLMLGFSAVCGYFSHPLISQWIPGQMEKKQTPAFGTIYQHSATLDNTIRNPVIVVPGMMGSKLLHGSDDRILWGVFDNEANNPVADSLSRRTIPVRRSFRFNQQR